MGYGYTGLCGRGLVAAVVVLGWGLGVGCGDAGGSSGWAATQTAARVSDDPADSTPDSTTEGTLLPPAGDDGVVIVPTDERPDDPAPDPAGATARDEPGGVGRFDLGDVDPLAAAGWVLLTLLSLAATAIAASRLARSLHGWRSPAAVRASGFRPATEPATSFSLLVAARRGEPGLGWTVDQLADLDHPAVEVLAVVGRDDAANRAAAVAMAARRPGRVRVVAVATDVGRHRAAALDQAVAVCRGDVVGVFRPGDEVDRRLLGQVDGCFAEDGADAVQGGVLLVARRWRWFTVRQVVDRYFWYRSRLHFHAQQRFMPLDETTVFVRAEVLRAAGGWHRQSVDEGCDLGVRLSVNGARVVARYDPALVTRVGAAPTVRALLRDETRRVRGYLQVLRSGVWRRLSTRRQRLLARAMLVRPLVEPLTGLTISLAAVGVVVAGASVPLVLLTLVAAAPVLLGLGVELAGLTDLRQLHGERILVRDRIQLVVSTLPYQVLQAAAALRALGAELGAIGRRRGAVPVVPAASPRLRPVSLLGPMDRPSASNGDRPERVAR